ncbi:MAG: DOMON-like domain-containing protein [Betaproteobacteria bacterium]|nr:DOMON-like domain-containing protein [Betaproteobacteria bacterium]
MARYNTPMASSPGHTVTLTCHPDAHGEAVRRIGARVARTPGGTLAITYIIEADIDRLRVPAPRPPAIAQRLWQHTCCEMFIARKDSPAYHEFNLAPSGEWAAYAFDRYRDGALLPEEALEPHVVVRSTREELELDAVIRLDRLSRTYAETPLLLALSAVIEDEDGSLSYWALRHPPGAPDFHHPHAFALELE